MRTWSKVALASCLLSNAVLLGADIDSGSVIRCVNPKPVTHSGSGRKANYTFSSEVDCTVSNVSMDFDALRQRYVQISRDSSPDPVASGDMTGFKVSSTRTYNVAGEGKMVVRFDETIANNDQKLVDKAQSAEFLQTDGNTEYTRSINEDITVTLAENNVAKVNVKKTIVVYRPWIAPEGIFVERATNNLTQDLKDLGNEHSARVKAANSSTHEL